MAHIPDSEENYVFHSLLTSEDVVEAEACDFAHLLKEARSQLKTFDGSIDGIVSFWDFPSTELRATLDAYLNGSRVFSKSWDEKVDRKLL